VGLFLSGSSNIKKKNNNYHRHNASKDASNDFIISQYDTNHGNNDKPLARLLIVDDDPDIVRVLKRGLQQNRFLVDAFTDPEDALQSIKSNAESYYRLMLSDVRMPSLSGIQLARKVKEASPSVKVILMTAFEIRDNEFSKVFPSTQVDGFVQKPISIKELTDKVLSIIGEFKDRTDEKIKT
jgi:DNA-binding response OmpR family regulator